MKKIIFILSLLVMGMSFCGCSEIKNKDLYAITDKYVKDLNTTQSSYGLFSGEENMTKDGKYKIAPIGRTVTVRIEEDATSKNYDTLKNEFQSHYNDNPGVSKVYISDSGILIIDCRR